MQQFLHGGIIPIVGLPTGGAGESSHHHSLPLSLFVPTQPSSSKVGESSEEREYSDDAEYCQLLKDYRKVQALLSSSRLNTEMLGGELDVTRDALQVSENEATQA